METDRAPEHYYTSQTHPYFRAPHLYLSLAARFVPKRQVITEEEARAIGAEHAASADRARRIEEDGARIEAFCAEVEEADLAHREKPAE